MNPKISLTDRNKKILLAVGAVVLCVFVGSVVYVALKTVAPKNNNYVTEEPSENTSELTAEERMVKDADAAFKAGQDAFNAGNSEEAVAKLNDAKKLYEQANDTVKAEQTVDYMSFVEQETMVEEEQQKREASPDDAKATNQP